MLSLLPLPGTTRITKARSFYAPLTPLIPLGRALLALSLACAPMATRQPVSEETAEQWKRLLSTDEGSPVMCWTTAISALHEHFGVSPILPDPGLDCLVCWKSHQVTFLFPFPNVKFHHWHRTRVYRRVSQNNLCATPDAQVMTMLLAELMRQTTNPGDHADRRRSPGGPPKQAASHEPSLPFAPSASMGVEIGGGSIDVGNGGDAIHLSREGSLDDLTHPAGVVGSVAKFIGQIESGDPSREEDGDLGEGILGNEGDEDKDQLDGIHNDEATPTLAGLRPASSQTLLAEAPSLRAVGGSGFPVSAPTSKSSSASLRLTSRHGFTTSPREREESLREVELQAEVEQLRHELTLVRGEVTAQHKSRQGLDARLKDTLSQVKAERDISTQLRETVTELTTSKRSAVIAADAASASSTALRLKLDEVKATLSSEQDRGAELLNQLHDSSKQLHGEFSQGGKVGLVGRR